MIAFFPREDHLLFGPSEAVVHKLHGPQSGIDGGGAAGGEKDIIQIARSKIGQFLGQNRAGLGHIGKGRGIGHFQNLL